MFTGGHGDGVDRLIPRTQIPSYLRISTIMSVNCSDIDK